MTTHSKQETPDQDERVAGHYDEKYFSWHRKLEDCSFANVGHFSAFVGLADRVLDFGCGSGKILGLLKVGQKIGVEPNESAHPRARENGLTVFRTLDEIEDESIDVAISNSALEHCLDPLGELKRVLQKLRPGGKAVFVVPCETIRVAWRPNDRNWHIFTWSPMCIGNLFSEAGFSVQSSERLRHKWPPKSSFLVRILPGSLFQLACKITGNLPSSIYQVRVVALRASK